MNVLFVDDEVDAADALSLLATSLGHEASVAYDAHTAVALARATVFDLILLDLQLGDRDGRVVCAEIRLEGRSKNTQIVAMTGFVGLEQTISLGDFNGYVVKPLRFDRLEELLTS